MFRLYDIKGGTRQWGVEASNGGVYVLQTYLNMLGEKGWELVSLNPESFKHFDTATDVTGHQLASYPRQQTMNTVYRAVLKRRLPGYTDISPR